MRRTFIKNEFFYFSLLSVLKEVITLILTIEIGNRIRRLNFLTCIIKMSLKQFDIISKLGDGTYSTVYKVTRKLDNQLYALKRVKMVSLTNKQKQNALNEIRILASIHHPNIISYKHAFLDENTKSLYIVTQFCNNGDLSHYIETKKAKKQTFKQQQIWNIFLQAIKGLHELHRLNIFHRDIKPANIFLHQSDGHLYAKLGDMNVSKISEEGLCMTQTGTPYYASPQVWKDKPYNQKSDIWSMGCVLYQMIGLSPPFTADDMEGLFKKVVRGIYSRIPNQYSQDLSSMIRFLLQVNPEMRPSCQKILKMSSMMKKTNESQQVIIEKAKLLQTIRGGVSFSDLNENLPKANYLPVPNKKQKGAKSMIQSHDQKFESKKAFDIESLPFVEKEKYQRKVKAAENSDRIMLREKCSINMLGRERKKSEAGMDKCEKISSNEVNLINSKSSNSYNSLIKDIKLPKVQQPRNNKEKQKDRLIKQKSLRVHKLND